MKKEWKQPELTVLVRTRPEEAILGGCKLAPVTGPGTLQTACYQTDGDDPPNCTICSLIEAS